MTYECAELQLVFAERVWHTDIEIHLLGVERFDFHANFLCASFGDSFPETCHRHKHNAGLLGAYPLLGACW